MKLITINFIRGIGFILMLIYHILLFLKLFSQLEINMNNIIIDIIGIIARNIFIILFGFSLYLSYNNYKNKKEKYKKKYIEKIKLLFLSGLLISLFSYYIIPDSFIYFGVLHFMCLSMIILYNFIDKTYILVILYIILILIKPKILYYINSSYTNNIILNILGFGFFRSSIDLFYVLKWLDKVILGILICKILINDIEKIEKKNKDKLKNNIIIKNINIIGSNTLLLYNIHFIIIYIIIKIIYN